MKAVKQLVICLVIFVLGLYGLATQVPSAQPILDRFGVLKIMGIELAENSGAKPAQRRRASGPIKVVTTLVKERTLSDKIVAIGDGRAKHSVTVRSNAVGVITRLSLEAGSYVKAGSIIAQLRDEAEQIALEQAQIELADAQNEGNRIKRLEAVGTVTEVRLNETKLALRTAELAMRQAEFDLSQRKVVAPISGWVGLIDVQEGDRVNAQDILATITDRSDILIDFRVSERVVGKLRVGQNIQITPLGLRDTTLNGEVAAIDSVVDRASRTLLVQGRVANEKDLLRAGMAFSVSMSFPGETLMSIAPLSLQWSSDGPFVWVIRDNKAQQAPVSIVQRNSDSVLVTSDTLRRGETIVTEGVQTLRNGAEVEILDQAAAFDGLKTKETL